jgi:single-strand selective monofunctional uracil DNA glycosylase
VAKRGADRLWQATVKARDAVDRLRFAPPVACVYDPLRYAERAHRAYVDRFGGGTKRVLLLGMNPGPFGMVQTGVPFGEIAMVRDWIGIDEPVDKPEVEHPKRRIEGFACKRSEVSGKRLWGLFRARFGTPEAFFKDFWVHNYCPLAFLEETGRNRTPDKLPAAEREALFAICDDYLREVTAALKPEIAVGVGAFAEACLTRVLGDAPDAPRIGRIPHPSPASPIANRGWDEPAVQALSDLGIELPGA